MEMAGRILERSPPGHARPRSGPDDRACRPGMVQVDGAGLAQRWPGCARRPRSAVVVGGETRRAGGRRWPSSPALDCSTALGAALADAGVPFGPAAGALDDTVTLLPIEAVKGLEFDSVIVVEPAAHRRRDAPKACGPSTWP